jgi:hypothetical protein
MWSGCWVGAWHIASPVELAGGHTRFVDQYIITYIGYFGRKLLLEGRENKLNQEKSIYTHQNAINCCLWAFGPLASSFAGVEHAKSLRGLWSESLK